MAETCKHSLAPVYGYRSGHAFPEISERLGYRCLKCGQEQETKDGIR
jgi:hypothetical protein